MIYYTKNSNETENIAEEIAKKLSSGDVILLLGDMGVGKTVFTKGICRALGVKDYVTSPTFTVVNEYEGENFPVYHFDLYRIEDMDELVEIGFEEYLLGSGVCIIEWPQIAGHLLPKKRYEIEIKRKEDVNEREIIVNKIL
ncbi:MAG: tRNA (adenosine(37)-N6)-threonylcarbamoyltransferase complex ATPase subunit type 1 TsaE [Clostridia bacterium]|nr:tRNA (adenosine(37)-N6)-threonylcarbamoyltransferase complex ATPase subunit type 1 TsaE [Clostridia bacterium]